ncbi:gluconokinase [Galbitalea sp. SE-J8]|uniref:gluconokinase n=1 Tax=Galbitalea sp. SE-J8 TaxID=3054952 RepID=UPI00259D28D9|nr:gluconokinase [Galbitalea sp. SE-J8]MDM4762793.1 gluconokinase [Galbitalea sp. SE-J8]
MTTLPVPPREPGPLVLGPLVLMGVSGSGKSTTGVALAARTGLAFVDGDDLHPAANREKMRAGVPLGDADRAPWLASVGAVLAEAGGSGVVVACSALRRRYRDGIRAAAPATCFVHLDGAPALIDTRVAAREHAYMPASLLASQVAALEPLEPDEVGFRVDTTGSTDRVVDEILDGVAALALAGAR